jgi:hypothetical protein
MTLSKLSSLEKNDLIELLMESSGTLKKKNIQLRTTRQKLNSARTRLRKMKDIIVYQRERILQYHSE